MLYRDKNSESPDFNGTEKDGLVDEATQDFEETNDEIGDYQKELQDPSLVRRSSKDLNDAYDSATAQQVELIHTTTPEQSETLGDDDDHKNNSGDHEAEEDLIDYSDEELEDTQVKAETETSNLPADSSSIHTGTYIDFISPYLRPSSCFCSKCSALIVAEEKAKDEELRQRSVTRVAEDVAPDQEFEEKVVTSNKDGLKDPTLDSEDGFDYDEDHYHEEAEPGYLNARHDDPSIDDGVIDHPEVQVQSHSDELPVGNDISSHEMSGADLEATDLTSEPRNEFDLDKLEPGRKDASEVFDDGVQFVDDDFTAIKEYKGPPEGDPDNINDTPSGDLDNLSKGPIDLDLEAPDAGSDTVESDKTLEALPASEIEQEDEIDYDDEDEEQDTLGVKSLPLKPKEVPTPQIGLGKRARTEETPNEDVRMSNKGSYPLNSLKRWYY